MSTKNGNKLGQISGVAVATDLVTTNEDMWARVESIFIVNNAVSAESVDIHAMGRNDTPSQDNIIFKSGDISCGETEVVSNVIGISDREKVVVVPSSADITVTAF